MKAFVEMLCEHAGIVRAGPLAEKHGDPYEHSCIFKILPEARAQLEGYADTANVALVRAVGRALSAHGLTGEFDRLNHKPRRVIMPKEKIPHVREVFNADGSVNMGTLKSGLAHALGQIHDKHYSIRDGVAMQEDIGNGDTRISISFVRHEN